MKQNCDEPYKVYTNKKVSKIEENLDYGRKLKFILKSYSEVMNCQSWLLTSIPTKVFERNKIVGAYSFFQNTSQANAAKKIVYKGQTFTILYF